VLYEAKRKGGNRVEIGSCDLAGLKERS
jgi:hypothetical protein